MGSGLGAGACVCMVFFNAKGEVNRCQGIVAGGGRATASGDGQAADRLGGGAPLIPPRSASGSKWICCGTGAAAEGISIRLPNGTCAASATRYEISAPTTTARRQVEGNDGEESELAQLANKNGTRAGGSVTHPSAAPASGEPGGDVTFAARARVTPSPSISFTALYGCPGSSPGSVTFPILERGGRINCFGAQAQRARVAARCARARAPVTMAHATPRRGIALAGPGLEAPPAVLQALRRCSRLADLAALHGGTWRRRPKALRGRKSPPSKLEAPYSRNACLFPARCAMQLRASVLHAMFRGLRMANHTCGTDIGTPSSPGSPAPGSRTKAPGSRGEVFP